MSDCELRGAPMAPPSALSSASLDAEAETAAMSEPAAASGSLAAKVDSSIDRSPSSFEAGSATLPVCTSAALFREGAVWRQRLSAPVAFARGSVSRLCPLSALLRAQLFCARRRWSVLDRRVLHICVRAGRTGRSEEASSPTLGHSLCAPRGGSKQQAHLRHSAEQQVR